VGCSKWLLDRIIEHVRERKQFGRPIGDFELVQEKIGWMVAFTFGLESMAYMTTGLVDADVPDYSLESAICKVSGTEFMWYAANRALQLKGGAGYMRDEPYEKLLRDIRIFPIFEGANDVMRAFIALSGIKPLGEELQEMGDIGLGDPIGSIGVLADYVGGRIKRQVRPDRVTKAHDSLSELSDPLSGQVKRLREVAEKCLREHRKGFMERQFLQKRLSDAVSDIYAQVATLSRVTSIFDEQGVEPSGQERYIAETFCTRAARRVDANLDQVESNDDDRMAAIAKLAYKRGEYGYALFD
jgi:acyl-CoA dehydrogenase family protein 9